MEKMDIRGFGEYGEGIDTHGFRWAVRESSLVGEPHCWFFIKDDRPRRGALHLHYTQVQELVAQLGKFPDLKADSYGSGTAHHGIKWELRNVSADQPCLGVQVRGVLKGRGPLEERTILGRLFLNIEQAAALKLHFTAFLEHSRHRLAS